MLFPKLRHRSVQVYELKPGLSPRRSYRHSAAGSPLPATRCDPPFTRYRDAVAETRWRTGGRDLIPQSTRDGRRNSLDS